MNHKNGALGWVMSAIVLSLLGACGPSSGGANSPGGGPSGGDSSECNSGEGPMDPNIMSDAAWAQRPIARASRFSDLSTSKERPAKTCGAGDSYSALAQLTCDDGSHPFATAIDAGDARVGNVGPGGQCGSIIDLYEVDCNEGKHEVFVDMYWCREGQSMLAL